MDVVADASAFLAVVLNEAARDSIIRSTAGRGIVAPEILPYEIGNALVVVRKKGRLTDREVLQAFDRAQQIPVTLLPVTIPSAVKLAMQLGIYGYDAYYLQCCIENRLPLLSLDVRMCEVAKRLRIQIVEWTTKTYTYSEARNRLAEVLEESKRGEVLIRRRRGDTFAVVPKSRARRSPFDVPGVGRGIARRELLSAIRESRSRRGSSRRAGR